MGHSRITLATLFALGLLGTVQADEAGREPFLVELKGPDGSPPPAVQPEPQTLSAAPVNLPKAQPIVRQVSGTQAGSYGPIRSTDTLWSLANKHRPDSRVSVYQTMVAIYDKNPRSFADGNINHILVGSRILLPSAAEASRITDAQARQRFNSDNASWKGLSPKYLASKQAQPAKAATAETKPAAAPAPVVKAAPLPAAPAPAVVPKVTAPQPASEVMAVVKAAEPVPSQAVSPAQSAPAPLPAEVAAPVGKPSTEMALALEDANAQLGQVTEMNHRLKLRLQSLTEEVETLKAQLQDQTALQKEIAELKARPVPPVVAPAPKPGWPMALLASPLNLAMIILLPVLLLALVTLWLRARARRELEEQEKSLSESTAMVMGEESREFDQLMTVGITDDEPQGPVVERNSPEPGAQRVQGTEEDTSASAGAIVRDDETASPAVEGAPVVTGTNREPALDLAWEGEVDLSVLASSGESDVPGRERDELMSEEELQAALFAELGADLDADLMQTTPGDRRDEALVSFDLSDVDIAFDAPADGAPVAKGEAAGHDRDDVDDMLAELGLVPESQGAMSQPAWEFNEPALADFEDAFTEVEPHGHELTPREQAQANDFVAIDRLLAEANASSTEQEPYQGFSLDVGLDGFPEVLPQSNGFDVDADDGGVGAKLDLARAYLEIDDRESARELLQEAAAQGSEHQRAEAERLLRRLG